MSCRKTVTQKNSFYALKLQDFRLLQTIYPNETLFGTRNTIINTQLLIGVTGYVSPRYFFIGPVTVFMQLIEFIKTVRDHTKTLKLTRSNQAGTACFKNHLQVIAWQMTPPSPVYWEV